MHIVSYDIIIIHANINGMFISLAGASGYVIRHTLYYDSLVVIGQFLSITVCMQNVLRE